MLTHKIIHRDLKLANVFINDSQFKIGQFLKLLFFLNKNKLGDFGFAIKLNHSEELIQSEMVGTPIYMSPQCM